MQIETQIQILLQDCLPSCPLQRQSLALESVAEGLMAPLHLEQLTDSSWRKLIVQRDGVVKVLDGNNKITDRRLLKLHPRIHKLQQDFEECGLLGFPLRPGCPRSGSRRVTIGAL